MFSVVSTFVPTVTRRRFRSINRSSPRYFCHVSVYLYSTRAWIFVPFCSSVPPNQTPARPSRYHAGGWCEETSRRFGWIDRHPETVEPSSTRLLRPLELSDHASLYDEQLRSRSVRAADEKTHWPTRRGIICWARLRVVRVLARERRTMSARVPEGVEFIVFYVCTGHIDSSACDYNYDGGDDNNNDDDVDGDDDGNNNTTCIITDGCKRNRSTRVITRQNYLPTTVRAFQCIVVFTHTHTHTHARLSCAFVYVQTYSALRYNGMQREKFRLDLEGEKN